MASLPIRDPIGDHLLTPQNAALVVIDYQPSQFAAVGSIDHDLLLENIDFLPALRLRLGDSHRHRDAGSVHRRVM